MVYTRFKFNMKIICPINEDIEIPINKTDLVIDVFLRINIKN